MRVTTRYVSCWCLVVVLATLLIGGAPASARAESCTELIVNGGFETNDAWVLGVTPIPPQYVTYTRHGGDRALALGITSGANEASFSSARQTVTIPAGTARATLTFWFYAMAGSPATTDYMELVLLDATGAAILAKPWQSHNDSRLWNQLSFDLTSWRGQTVQVYFNVYNDGVGGTAAMFLDDIVLQACSGGPVASQTPVPCATSTPACSTPSATPLATATCTVAPTATKTPACGVTPTCVTPAASPTPAITYTPVPPGCTQSLVHNGGFESGLLPWRRGADLLPATIVSDPVSEGAYAVRLGSQTENYNTFSSIRQTVTVPWGYPRALVSFRAYPWAESLTGHDIQQFVVLGTDDSIWGVPWRVLEDAPDWQWYVFDLVGGTGQTFDLYFNAYNDGEGGRTALFVDDVQMWGCTPGEYPDELLAAGVTVYNGAGATAVVPIPPGGREQVATTLTPWGEMTRVAIDLTKESYVGLNLTPGAEATPRPADTRIAPTSTRGAATATSVTATPTPGPTAPSLPDRLRDLWQRIKDWWNRVRTLRTLVK